ncbi:hypothetical protein HPB47_008209 [Ixodes persulcatus]|uniref:Uncharacterized protein n=1 Tax=Ixodes persulcatus TaxID=34615 RepID=A0AC60P5C5_IXOPE|nr:hypothetical protein HPB47_008209 [Ixodes persulcatus]
MDKKCRKLKNYSARISRLFPRNKTARQIFASLRSTKSALSARGVDYDQPCTVSDTQCCHILDDLSFWNELLWLCHLEMREEAPGELGTDCLVGFTPIIASEAMCCHAHIVLHWLLTEHRCIRTLKVKGVVACRNPRLFLDALRLNNGLRRLELHECDLEDDQLVKLEITLAEEMSTSCAELLARFLSSTKKLRHADLNFPTTISATQILLDAMSRNNSVSTLILSNWHFLSYHAEDFAETLGRNETLNYLELHDMKADLILNELSATVEGNKFLVSIKVDDDCHVDDEVWMFKVMDVLRRNFSLLQRAVHFVMGRCDKRCGEAFEEVFRSRALSEKVQQLSGGSESDAEERIRKARRHLDANFMAVAGVVSEVVVCDGGRLGQTRLDQIGLDNWLRVRSYLKLTDIKDTPTRVPACELTKGF